MMSKLRSITFTKVKISCSIWDLSYWAMFEEKKKRNPIKSLQILKLQVVSQFHTEVCVTRKNNVVDVIVINETHSDTMWITWRSQWRREREGSNL